MRRERNNRERRARLLAVARELFDAEGFDATTVDQIAAAAEVATRTVYNFFPVKVDLLGAVVSEEIKARMRAGRPSQDVLPADPHAGVLALIAAQIDTMAAIDKGEQKRVIARSVLAGGHSEAGRYPREIDDFMRVMLRDRIAHYVDTGALRPDLDPDVCACLVFATLNGLYADWLLGDAAFQDAVPQIAQYLELIFDTRTHPKEDTHHAYAADREGNGHRLRRRC